MNALNSFQHGIIALQITFIKAWVSGTSATLTGELENTVSGVTYVISDPVDLPEHMHTVMQRVAEKHLAERVGMKNLQSIQKSARDALQRAKANDFGQRRGREVAGVSMFPLLRLADSRRPNMAGFALRFKR